MRINAIRIGNNPLEDVNVIIEVPIGGEPIKYEMDKLPGGRPVPAYPDAATTASCRTRSRTTAFRHLTSGLWWSMIFSENRYPLFGIML